MGGRGCWRGSRRTGWPSGILAEIDGDSVSNPGRDAASEEIAILGPARQIRCEGSCHDGPIIRIARNSQAGIMFSSAVGKRLDKLDDSFDIAEKA